MELRRKIKGNIAMPIIIASITLLIVVGLVLAITGAWFSDSRNNGGNQRLQFGAVDMIVSDDSTTDVWRNTGKINGVLNANEIAPGSTFTTDITISNVGTVDAYIRLIKSKLKFMAQTNLGYVDITDCAGVDISIYYIDNETEEIAVDAETGDPITVNTLDVLTVKAEEDLILKVVASLDVLQVKNSVVVGTGNTEREIPLNDGSGNAINGKISISLEVEAIQKSNFDPEDWEYVASEATELIVDMPQAMSSAEYKISANQNSLSSNFEIPDSQFLNLNNGMYATFFNVSLTNTNNQTTKYTLTFGDDSATDSLTNLLGQDAIILYYPTQLQSNEQFEVMLQNMMSDNEAMAEIFADGKLMTSVISSVSPGISFDLLPEDTVNGMVLIIATAEQTPAVESTLKISKTTEIVYDDNIDYKYILEGLTESANLSIFSTSVIRALEFSYNGMVDFVTAPNQTVYIPASVSDLKAMDFEGDYYTDYYADLIPSGLLLTEMFLYKTALENLNTIPDEATVSVPVQTGMIKTTGTKLGTVLSALGSGNSNSSDILMALMFILSGTGGNGNLMSMELVNLFINFNASGIYKLIQLGYLDTISQIATAYNQYEIAHEEWEAGNSQVEPEWSVPDVTLSEASTYAQFALLLDSFHEQLGFQFTNQSTYADCMYFSTVLTIMNAEYAFGILQMLMQTIPTIGDLEFDIYCAYMVPGNSYLINISDDMSFNSTFDIGTMNLSDYARGDFTAVKCEAFNVSSSSFLSSRDGVLYSADGSNLICWPALKSAETFKIPAGVTSSNTDAFKNVTGTIGTVVFEDERDLTDIYDIPCDAFDATNSTLYSSLNGILYSSNGKTLIAFPKFKTLASWTLPETLTGANPYSLRNTQNLSRINVHTSLMEYGSISNEIYQVPSSKIKFIADGFIGYRQDVQQQILGRSYELAEIDYGFSYEYNSTYNGLFITGYDDSYDKISISSTVTYNGETYNVVGIADELFKNDTNLTDLRIPSTLKYFGNDAIAGCTSLTELYLENCALSYFGTGNTRSDLLVFSSNATTISYLQTNFTSSISIDMSFRVTRSSGGNSASDSGQGENSINYTITIGALTYNLDYQLNITLGSELDNTMFIFPANNNNLNFSVRAIIKSKPEYEEYISKIDERIALIYTSAPNTVVLGTDTGSNYVTHSSSLVDVTYSTKKSDSSQMTVKAGDRLALSITFDVLDGVQCFTAGTLVTLADGSQKLIENVTYDDLLLTYDFDRGEFGYSYPAWIAGSAVCNNYYTLYFDDGSYVNLVINHRLFVENAMDFEKTNDDAKSKIGQTFVRQVWDENGNPILKTVKCTNIIFKTEECHYYNMITSQQLNFFANGFLGSTGISNLYTFEKIDSQTYIHNQTQLERTLSGTDDDVGGTRYRYERFDTNIIPYYIYVAYRLGETRNMADILAAHYGYPTSITDKMAIDAVNDYFSEKFLDEVNSRPSTYKITFSDRNSDIRLMPNQEYILPAPVEQENFVGWYSSFDGKLYQAGDEITLLMNTHFIARYSNV